VGQSVSGPGIPSGTTITTVTSTTAIVISNALTKPLPAGAALTFGLGGLAPNTVITAYTSPSVTISPAALTATATFPVSMVAGAAVTGLKFYPTTRVKCLDAKYSTCTTGGTEVPTSAHPSLCIAGGGTFAPGTKTAGEVPIGYCKSSDGKTEKDVAIPGGGYCALSDVCDDKTAKHCATSAGVKLSGVTETKCVANGPICEKQGHHGLSRYSDVDENGCAGKGGTWKATGIPAGVQWVADLASKETFKAHDHNDNPGCFLTDLKGDPSLIVAPASSAAGLTPAAAASVAIAAALGSALMA
jgi:hypothetical protein